MTSNRWTPLLILIALLACAYRWPVAAQNVAAWIVLVMIIGGLLTGLSVLVRLAMDYVGPSEQEYDAFEKARLDLFSRNNTDLTAADREALRERLDLGPVHFNTARGVYVLPSKGHV